MYGRIKIIFKSVTLTFKWAITWWFITNLILDSIISPQPHNFFSPEFVRKVHPKKYHTDTCTPQKNVHNIFKRTKSDIIIQILYVWNFWVGDYIHTPDIPVRIFLPILNVTQDLLTSVNFFYLHKNLYYSVGNNMNILL